MATLLDSVSRPGENRETGWVNRLFTKEGYTPEYQELKFTLHRKLLDRINLEALSSMAGERVRAEIRAAVAKLVEEEKTPLSLVEKDRVIEEILDEVFGLGPLEPLLQDPTVSDILVTTPHHVYVERGGKLYRTPVEFKDDAHLLRIIEKIVSRVGRRVDESSPMVDARLPDGSRGNAGVSPGGGGGPAGGRMGADGGRAAARWLARQRGDSAGGGGRPAALHPPIRPPRAQRRGSGGEVRLDGRHAGAAESVRESAVEHPDLRRYGFRQDHAAQRGFFLHPGRRTHRDH